MRNQSTIRITVTSLTMGAALSLPVYADHHETKADSETMRQVTAAAERKTSDAWREGKLDTIYLFNRHLNNFTIDPEVKGNSVVLTGEVESEVDSELAEQLAKGMSGIMQVTNRLTVVPSEEDRAGIDDKDRDFSDKVEDATLTAEIKTKLLANSQTGGFRIKVDTVARNVILTGTVKSSAEKDLAGEIAKQVDGVHSVDNELMIKE